MIDKLRISYMNGDETIYPFEKPEDRPKPSKCPPKKSSSKNEMINEIDLLFEDEKEDMSIPMRNRRHTDHKKTDGPFHSAEFITPEKNTIQILLKAIWTDVYIAAIQAGSSTLLAKENAEQAVKDYKEAFNNG